MKCKMCGNKISKKEEYCSYCNHQNKLQTSNTLQQKALTIIVIIIVLFIIVSRVVFKLSELK